MVWGLEPSLCKPRPHGRSPLLPSKPRLGGRNPGYLLHFPESQSGRQNFPCLDLSDTFNFCNHHSFPLLFLVSTISLPRPRTLVGCSSASIWHLWASDHLDISCLFSCLHAVWSSLCHQRDPGPNLIRAGHSPAQNLRWFFITPGIKCRLLGLAFRIPAQSDHASQPHWSCWS